MLSEEAAKASYAEYYKEMVCGSYNLYVKFGGTMTFQQFMDWQTKNASAWWNEYISNQDKPVVVDSSPYTADGSPKWQTFKMVNGNIVTTGHPNEESYKKALEAGETADRDTLIKNTLKTPGRR